MAAPGGAGQAIPGVVPPVQQVIPAVAVNAGVNPAADLRQYLTVCGLNTLEKRECFIDRQGLTSITDFLIFDKQDTKDMVQNHNNMEGNRVGHKIGHLQQRNLTALAWWYQDRRRRQLRINVNEYTDDAQATALMNKNIYEQMKDSDNEPPKLRKIETDLGWYD